MNKQIRIRFPLEVRAVVYFERALTIDASYPVSWISCCVRCISTHAGDELCRFQYDGKRCNFWKNLKVFLFKLWKL